MKEYEDLKRMVTEMETDVHKFENGVDAAGARLRKVLFDIKNKCGKYRKNIQERRNSRE